MKCGGKFEKGDEKLKSIPVPRLPWRQLGIHCITNLPATDEGYDTIVTAIDYTSKWPECKVLKGKFIDVAELVYELVCYHGAVKIHIFDQGENLSTRCVQIPVCTLCTCVFLV